MYRRRSIFRMRNSQVRKERGEHTTTPDSDECETLKTRSRLLYVAFFSIQTTKDSLIFRAISIITILHKCFLFKIQIQDSVILAQNKINAANKMKVKDDVRNFFEIYFILFFNSRSLAFHSAPLILLRRWLVFLFWAKSA
jgi:hypothetical protein